MESHYEQREQGLQAYCLSSQLMEFRGSINWIFLLLCSREMQAKFAEERDWDQFHSPRNLLLAMVSAFFVCFFLLFPICQCRLGIRAAIQPSWACSITTCTFRATSLYQFTLCSRQGVWLCIIENCIFDTGWRSGRTCRAIVSFVLLLTYFQISIHFLSMTQSDR